MKLDIIISRISLIDIFHCFIKSISGQFFRNELYFLRRLTTGIEIDQTLQLIYRKLFLMKNGI